MSKYTVKIMQLPAIPVIIDFDQQLEATWRHHQPENRVVYSNDLVKKFPDIWEVHLLRPEMKRDKNKQMN